MVRVAARGRVVSGGNVLQVRTKPASMTMCAIYITLSYSMSHLFNRSQTDAPGGVVVGMTRSMGVCNMFIL